MKQQSGFTLIELIAVIVILGVLAATTIPRFVNLQASAREASLQGVAGGLASASALNHANNIARKAGLTTNVAATPVATCQAVATTLDTGAMPTGFEIVTGTGTTIAGGGVATDGGSSTCQVRLTANPTTPAPVSFVAYGVVP